MRDVTEEDIGKLLELVWQVAVENAQWSDGRRALWEAVRDKQIDIPEELAHAAFTWSQDYTK